MIVDASGRQITSVPSQDTPCPKCNDGRKTPNTGFGKAYLICVSCGYNFNKELKYERTFPSS